MTTEKKIEIGIVIAKYAAAILVLWFLWWFLFGSEYSVSKALGHKLDERQKINDARHAESEAKQARYPDEGSRIKLDDGTEVVILKYYFIKRGLRVRMPDGTITDALCSEVIDKKPITPED